MKATLFVSFGSTYQEAYQAAVKPLIEEIKLKTNGRVYEAITSRFVKRKLHSLGVSIDSLEDSLNRIQNDQVRELMVVSNFILPAYEYLRMKALIDTHLTGVSVRYTPALLEHLEDQFELVQTLEEIYHVDGKCLYFLGHGSEHPSGAILSQLQLIAESLGLNHCYQSIDGFPDEETTMKRLPANQDVRVIPLLSVAGDHGHNDTLAVSQKLEALGHKVERVVIGLGEQPKLRQLILKHV